jgi:phospholipase/carboxylesterase
MTITRRNFCALTGSTIASVTLGSSCSRMLSSMPNDGRLSARPRPDVKTAATGQNPLGLERYRDAVLQIPKNAGQSSLPLLVMLHGATQSAEDMFWYLGSTADEGGVAILAPNSRDTTWDAMGGGSFAEDVNHLNRALERVFEATAIDPARVSVGGFSDGASYALSLGLINGDFFRSIVAFSPGFVISGDIHGRPRVYISHGTYDHILPIDRCGRRIAAVLKDRGYDVTFHEFEGDHEIPADIAREGLLWV